MKTFLVLLLVFLSSCAHPQKDSPWSIEDVSLIRLIATPSQYDGKKVRIVGFLHMEFEGDAVYLHKEDYERGTWKNGLWVSGDGDMYATLRALSDHYVLIEGIFDSTNTGHLGGWSGSIRAISRVASWPPKFEATEEEKKPNQPPEPTAASGRGSS